jgi:hypothetical protein
MQNFLAFFGIAGFGGAVILLLKNRSTAAVRTLLVASALLQASFVSSDSPESEGAVFFHILSIVAVFGLILLAVKIGDWMGPDIRDKK